MTDEKIPFKAGCSACAATMPTMSGMTNYCIPHFNLMKEGIERAVEQFALPFCGECGARSKIKMSFYGSEDVDPLYFCSTECVRDAW